MSAQLIWVEPTGPGQVLDSSIDNTPQVNVAGRPCNIMAIVMLSASAVANHLRIYDLAQVPSVGATVPDFIFPINPSTFNDGLTIIIPEKPIYLANGLTYAGVVEAGTAGNTSPASTVKLIIAIKP